MRRWRIADERWPAGRDPFWYDCPMWDTTPTMVEAIRGAPRNCKMITLVKSGTVHDVDVAWACISRGIKVVWCKLRPSRDGRDFGLDHTRIK